MILPDTSAWVEFLRHTGSAVNVELRSLIDSGAKILVSDPIWMELLAGARTAEEHQAIGSLLNRFQPAPVSGLTDWRSAARLFAACRAGGETPRSQLDCLIAAVAIRRNAALLHADGDFEAIARHTPLVLAAP